MDPWDNIDPYASSSSSRYGDPVSGTSNKTNDHLTSRCKWSQANKSNPRINNLPLSSAFQEGKLSCSRSAQGQWGKTNNHVGGISSASTKNNLPLHTKGEQRGSYWCQWKNEEAPPSDTHRKGESSHRFSANNKNTHMKGESSHRFSANNKNTHMKGESSHRFSANNKNTHMKGESSYRFSANNKNDSNSKTSVAAERVIDLPAETRLECQRSLFDIDYEAETKLQAKNYHSGGNHNNVAEFKLNKPSRCDRLDHVDEIKSDYDNLPEMTLQERDRRLATEENSGNKAQPAKRDESVGTRTALVPLVSGGAALSALSIPQVSEIQKSPCELPQRKRKRGRPWPSLRVKLSNGERLNLSKPNHHLRDLPQVNHN